MKSMLSSMQIKNGAQIQDGRQNVFISSFMLNYSKEFKKKEKLTNNQF
jgi:hypothetical protein